MEQGTAPKFKFYVTDFDQKEYMYSDTSESFVVSLWLDNVLQVTGTYAAGEHEITLPTMNTLTDEVRLSIQAKDSQNRKSDVLFQRFRVVDPAAQVITPSQTYSPSASTLQTTYGIYNNDTNPTTTTTGLTALLQWSATSGYRKVVLPNGTYRLDPASTVKMASRLTLDLNGSTLKLNPSNLGTSTMVEIAHCFDSHVINGVIEGDLASHDYSVDPISEHVRGIVIAQGSEYCSFRDLVVKDITGYGSNTDVDFIGRVGPYNLSHNPQKAVGAFTSGEVNEATGSVVSSSDRVVTAAMVDISTFMSSYGFISFGKYLGYQSNPVDNWTYLASFYDTSNNYISSMVGCMYRRMYPPSNAKKVRFTLHSNETLAANTTYVFNFRYPYNCDFINIDHQDVRCVGMVPSGFNNLLVKDCTWNNCGWAAAMAAFDAEDGWDGMQDLVFIDNTFGTNPHSEFLGLGGHNFRLENNTLAFLNSARSGSLHLRNNTFKSLYIKFGPFSRSAHPRIYDNTVLGMTTLATDYDDIDREYCIRENELQGGVGTIGGLTRDVKLKMFSYLCDVPGGSINGRAVECNVDNVVSNGAFITKWFQFEGCTVTNSTLESSLATNWALIIDSAVSDTVITAKASTVRLVNNTLDNVECLTSGGWSHDQNWWLENNVVTTSLPHLVKVLNNFTDVSLHNNTITATGTSFYAVRLQNPNSQTTSTPTPQYVTVGGNTITSVAGGTVVSAGSVPKSNVTLTLGFANNSIGTLVQHSSNLSPLSNVVWVIPPSASVTSPANNSSFASPATISLTAAASDPDGTIAKVEFFVGNDKIGEDLVSPYALSLSAAPGGYSFTARATDNAGVVGVSVPVVSEVTP